MKKHLHKWVFENLNVVAEFEKREGGPKVLVRGDFQICIRCPEGRFVPYTSLPRQVGLRIVPCRRIFEVKELK